MGQGPARNKVIMLLHELTEALDRSKSKQNMYNYVMLAIIIIVVPIYTVVPNTHNIILNAAKCMYFGT